MAGQGVSWQDRAAVGQDMAAVGNDRAAVGKIRWQSTEEGRQCAEKKEAVGRIGWQLAGQGVSRQDRAAVGVG